MDRNTLQQYLFREVEIVQDIVARMANNQFYVKGWSITLIVASLFVCKSAATIDEAKALIEDGFEYVTEIEAVPLFRKRK